MSVRRKPSRTAIKIVELLLQCRGNLVRVHEELAAHGVVISYPALTASCRRHGIGHAPPPPVGHYDFPMGQEMQHDTSPHRAPIGGVEQRVHTAALALCYSRMLFIQMYPVFTRFTCKVFLTDALQYLTGAAKTCMIDNTHVVVATEADYYQRLNAVTSDGAWNPWILYLLEAAAETARWTTAKILAIRELLRDTNAYFQRESPAVYTHHSDIRGSIPHNRDPSGAASD